MSVGPFTHHWSSTGIAWDLYMVIDIFAYFGCNNNNKFVAFPTHSWPTIYPDFWWSTFLDWNQERGRCINLHFLVCFFNRFLMDQDLFQRLKKCWINWKRLLTKHNSPSVLFVFWLHLALASSFAMLKCTTNSNESLWKRKQLLEKNIFFVRDTHIKEELIPEEICPMGQLSLPQSLCFYLNK